MQLVKLTVSKRGAYVKSPAVSVAFDVDDISSPIRFNSVAYFKQKSKLNQIVTDFEVTETLSQIKAKSSKLILLEVISRAGRELNATEDMIFNASMMNEISESGGGAKFSYHEHGDPAPVEYEVSDSIDDIIEKVNDPSFMSVINDTGSFNILDTDNAIAVTINGTTRYIQLLTYTP